MDANRTNDDSQELAALRNEWGSADEALIQAGLEKCDLPKHLWNSTHYEPLYPRINQLNVRCESLRADVERLRKWEAQVIAALEGLPDNTAPDAIRVLRDRLAECEATRGY